MPVHAVRNPLKFTLPAVPFIQQSAVNGGWITNAQFLDGIAIGSVLPTPLVMFVTFVGYHF